MTASVVTGAPDNIWLCYGDLLHDDTHAECYGSGEVTWCDARQDTSDVQNLSGGVEPWTHFEH